MFKIFKAWSKAKKAKTKAVETTKKVTNYQVAGVLANSIFALLVSSFIVAVIVFVFKSFIPFGIWAIVASIVWLLFGIRIPFGWN